MNEKIYTVAFADNAQILAMIFFSSKHPSDGEYQRHHYCFDNPFRPERGHVMKVDVEEVREPGKANSSWALLIRKIFEVDML